MYGTPLRQEIRDLFPGKSEEEIRANFPGMTDDEIDRFFDDYFDSKKSKVEIDTVDITLAGILRNFGYQGLVDFLDGKPTHDEILRINQAADYLRLIEEQRRDSVVMISASEASKQKLADARNELSRQISRLGSAYEIDEL